MKAEHELLFTPFTIRNTEIKNRYYMAAMGTTTHNDEDGAYLPDAVDHYVRRAAGGVGLIITGANWVDNNIEVHSPGSFPCPTICPGKYIKSARELTDRVHAFGTKIFVQLTAGLGRSAMPAMIHDRKFVAPSTISNRWNPKIECRELTTEEVERIVEQFGVSAAIAKKCGYDGVEVHAVHEGYLLDCFAMSLFNKRTDKYGGDLRGRLTFAIEIVQKIKAYCGEDFPVILRFSLKSYIKDIRQGAVPGEEFTELGRDTEEGLEAAKILVEAGYDALDVDAGTYDSWYWAHPPMYFDKGVYLPFAEQVKNQISTATEKFTQEAFDKAQQEYSELMWTEIKDELRLSYSEEEVNAIFVLLNRITMPFSYDSLVERIAQLGKFYPNMSTLIDNSRLIQILEKLYELGVIGNTGKPMNFVFLGRPALDPLGAMVIHTPLRNYFSVQYK